MSIGGLEFEPITTDCGNAEDLARDLENYLLTGRVSGECLNEETLFRLEAVLSFIEHLEVLVSKPVETANSGEFVASDLPLVLATKRRNNGGGAVVGTDAFFPGSREKFIELALGKLGDDAFCKAKKFNSLFFKFVETFRQRRPFIEVTYFLLYSGLEAHARAVLNDQITRNSSVPISKLLESYGFNVYQNNTSDLPRSISTYTHIRNALFHNGEFQSVVRMNHVNVQLDLRKYLFNLSMLVSLTIMKALQFDDGHINWDSWIDRQPFK